MVELVGIEPLRILKTGKFSALALVSKDWVIC
jgi:hypothetical protein